jgi:hypothetical protein
MTAKQIAEVAGVSVETVQKKVKELFPEIVKKGKQTNLTEPEAVNIMAELRKQGFVTPRKNDDVVTRSELAEFGRAIVSEMFGLFLPMIKNSPETPKPLAIAPPIATRDELRRIINKAAQESGDYPGTWNQLYEEIYYRLHINARERAKNAGVPAIDILEAEGYLPDSIAIARAIFA